MMNRCAAKWILVPVLGLSLTAAGPSLAQPQQAPPWQAEIDRQIDATQPQMLGGTLCDRLAQQAELEQSVTTMRASVQQERGPAAQTLLQILNGYEVDLEKRRYWLHKGRQVYERKLGSPFTDRLCTLGAAAPPGKAASSPPQRRSLVADENLVPAQLQMAACGEARVRAISAEALAGLRPRQGQRNLAEPMRLAMQQELRDQIEGYDFGIQRKQALFLRATGKEMDLGGCDGRKRLARTDLRAEGEFKRGCFYLICYGEPVPCHYFVGTIIEGEDGTFQYGAVGQCHEATCSAETAFLRKAHGSETLGRHLADAGARSEPTVPVCTADINAFAHGLTQAQQQAAAEDDVLRGHKDTLGFALTPFSCGLSKPCRMAAVRAWQAAGKALQGR